MTTTRTREREPESIGDIASGVMEVWKQRAREYDDKVARGEAPADEDAAKEAAEHRRHEVGRWVSNIVPARFHFAEADEDQIKNFESVLRQGRGIILTGKTGRGKTHAACGLLRHFLDVDRRPTQVAFHDTGMLLSQLRPGGSVSPPTLHELGRLKLLVLDDLAAHGDTGWVQEQLFTLLNDRYQDKRTTIITTNLPKGQFIEVLGQRLAGRLLETCDVIPFVGRDRRLSQEQAA